ncbi:MAG: hypothetical protein Q4E65_01260 [Clostridia bacterium]|nr:hypothetical protein [Clostridia bacterium]
MQKKEKTSVWQRLIARMKADKRFEATVYLVLLVIAASVYLLMAKTPVRPWDNSVESGADAIAVELEEALCCMQGVGQAKVMITRENDPQTVRGVIVVAEGAEDISVRLRIQTAVCTVLGIESERVEVFKMYEKAEEE